MAQDISKYLQRKKEIAHAAGEVTRTFIDSQSEGEGWAQSLTDAALTSPMFEGIADDKAAVTQIATAWGASIQEYCNTYGMMPREDLLASCGESLVALIGGGSGAPQSMFESLGGKESFATSEGVDIRAKTAALIMPVALSAVTNDAATFVQGGRDEVECFEIFRISNTDFGDVPKGERLDEFFFGQYSGMKQSYLLPTPPDGTKERYVVYVYDEAAPNEDLTALVSVLPNKNPKMCAFETRSVRILVDGKVVAASGDSGVIFGQFEHKAKDYSLVQDSVTHDPKRGRIGFKVSPALPATASIVVQYDVNIESGSANGAFPEINHEMESFKLRPHQSILAAQHTIQSYWAMSREYGIDLRSIQTSTQRNLMAYEKDVRNLREMILASSATGTKTIQLQVTAGAYFKEKYEEMHEALLLLSTSMMVDTKVSGLVGLFAGTGAANLMKALGAPFFVPAPNYRQVPRIHFCGTLFGKWKVFECPTTITVAGQQLGSMDAIGYARGDDFSQAGLIVGDAVSPTLYKHGVVSKMFNRDTLWELSYGDISPRGGEKFFRKITFTK